MKLMALLIASLALMSSASGCKIYQSLPLDQKAKAAALASPDLPSVQVRAKELRHPLLKPVPIDLKEGLTPDAAAVLAVLVNPDLKSVRDQRALAGAQLLDAGLLPDPILSYSQDHPVGGNDQGAVTAHSTQVSLDLTGMLTRSLRRRAAKAVQQSVDLDVAWQEWQVAEAAKLAVYRISALDPQVDFANEAVGALEEMRHAIEKAAARGEMSQSDVASIRIALEAGRRNSLSLRQSRDRERQTLNSLLGLPPHEQVALRNPSGKAPKRRLWDDLPSEQLLVQDLDQRLDLVALQKGYESQDARVRLAIWSQFPSIGLSLSRSRDTFNLQTRGFGVAVSLPIFNRGQGLVAIENATRRQLYDQYIARLFHARSDVAQILSDTKAVKDMIIAAEEALPALKAQAEAGDGLFDSGSIDLLSRNQMRLALLSHRATLANLNGNLDELCVALEIASGRPLQPEEGLR